MEIEVHTGAVEELEADALVFLGFEGEPPQGPAGKPTQGLYDSGEFSGETGETVILHNPSGFKAKRLVLAGGGKANKFGTTEMRKAAGVVLRSLKGKGVNSIAYVLTGAYASDEFAAAAVEGAVLGDFEPDVHKTDPKKTGKHISKVIMSGGSQQAVERGKVMGDAQNFARELANEPPNVLTPPVLAERAKQMAEAHGLECEVLEQDRMRQLGMGALLGVAQGSAEPPALIILRYRPENADVKEHLGLVGKGVTFDTGGISIKPSEGMEKMKYDMAGGAAAIGAMQAIAHLKPRIAVTALIPAVENMPGSRAQRPGDIVTSLSGKTIEVLNTDAEGRLILADAITYAERLGCTHLVDAATLTGAIVVALGGVHIGAFTNNEGFLQKVKEAGARQGERMWPMPLDDDYLEPLKSVFADIHNIGGRWGGAITAAMFLKFFVNDTPWVHLDIAGTAWLDDSKPDLAKGPTGIGVRTFVELATSW